MQPVDKSSDGAERKLFHHFESELNQRESEGKLKTYIPPLILPSGRPSLVRTASQIELPRGKNSPHSPLVRLEGPSRLTPKRPDFDTIPMITSKSERKKINKGCKKFIRTQFKSRNPTTINAKLLASKVDIVVRHEIESGFKSLTPTRTSIKQLILYIQRTGILVSNIQRRLQVLREIVENYANLHGKRTEFLCDLHLNISKLMNSSESLIDFMMILDSLSNITNKISEKHWEIFSLALEDQKGHIKPIYNLLNQWNHPTQSEIDILSNHIDQVSRIQSIPGTKISWIEGDDATYPIDHTPVNDVIRSMIPSDMVLMNQIKINGELFYDGVKNDGTSTTTQEDFFFFSSLAQCSI